MVKNTVEADLCPNFVPEQQIIAPKFWGKGSVFMACLDQFYILGIFMFQLSQDAQTFCPILHWGTHVLLLAPNLILPQKEKKMKEMKGMFLLAI